MTLQHFSKRHSPKCHSPKCLPPVTLYSMIFLAILVMRPQDDSRVVRAAEKSSSYAAALESISSADLEQRVEYLAADAMEGRESGTRGGRAAGDYLAGRMAQYRLAGAGVDGGFFQPFAPRYRNVLALLEGSDPALRHEIVILCAHYDHVGFGKKGNSRGPVGPVHNGADDNASGTAGLLELAEALTQLPEPPKRSILFAFWDAEEKGMLGSKYWVAHPTVPGKRVAAVINMDMIGRLRDERLHVYGSRTGCGLRRLISRHNDGPDLTLDFCRKLPNNADHYCFFERGIPVLFLHTGMHDDYHAPGDDAHLINNPGMRRVIRLVFGITHDLATRPDLPAFRRAAAHETERTTMDRGPNLPERLGVAWQAHAESNDGVLLTSVAPDSPAAQAGLNAGDRIVQFAGREIRRGDDLRTAVMTAKTPASLIVQPAGGEEPELLAVQLQGKPLRLGVTWQVDEAEPGAVILTRVVAGSPADRAGLRAGDRIYQINGHDFADDMAFAPCPRSYAFPYRWKTICSNSSTVFATKNISPRAARPCAS